MQTARLRHLTGTWRAWGERPLGTRRQRRRVQAQLQERQEGRPDELMPTMPPRRSPGSSAPRAGGPGRALPAAYCPTAAFESCLAGY